MHDPQGSVSAPADTTWRKEAEKTLKNAHVYLGKLVNE